MAQYSPGWKKPSDIMKIHRSRKRTSSVKTSLAAAGLTAGTNVQDGRKAQSRSKRKNPFGCSPRKKQILSEELDCGISKISQITSTEQHSPRLFDILSEGSGIQGSEQGKNALPQPDQKQPCLSGGGLGPYMDADVQPSTTEDQEAPVRAERHDWFPADWSLKTKLRFVSSSPFTWAGPIRAADEASGLRRFFAHQCQERGETAPQVADTAEERKCALQQSCMFWCHPNIPWLKLFPRMTTDNKIGKMTGVLQDPEVQKAMLSDWTESLTSAFHLLRAGSCPYFYLCGHQFTVAFYGPGADRYEGLHALLSPTSRGLREALHKEGIEFDMPLFKKKGGQTQGTSQASDGQTQGTSQGTNDQAQGTSQGTNGQAQGTRQGTRAQTPDTSPTTHSPPACGGDQRQSGVLVGESGDAQRVAGVTDNETPESERPGDVKSDVDSDVDDGDDGAGSWLETLGLDRRQFRSLDPNKVKVQRDSTRLIDNKAESVVRVQGAHTQALFNYLLNCRSCLANTGVQAGIPPTLLAPTAFQGATLRSLKVRQQGVVKHSAAASQAGATPGYSLEVTGPILPSAYSRLVALLHRTQPDLTLTCSVHEPSTPFNWTQAPEGATQSKTPPPSEGEGAAAALPWTPPSVVTLNLGKESVRELTMRDGLFTWAIY